MPKLIVVGPVVAKGHMRPHHLERPSRIVAAMQGVADLHLESDLRIVAPTRAKRLDLTRVHDEGYVDFIQGLSASGGGEIDADTYVTETSFDDASLAAGAGLCAIELLEKDPDAIAFIPIRPPGHHARRPSGMGFCLFNNIAVTAAKLLDAGQRVAILDWDVHHGNGTQDIFYDDDRVLFISTHQWPLYPGTGAPDEVGGQSARGLTVNVPVPAGATGDVLSQALDQVGLPILSAFEPTWVLISAGYDAHRRDRLANLTLSSGDFANLSRQVIAALGPKCRVVIFLEGGYDLDAVRHSVAATLGTFCEAPFETERPTRGGLGRDWVLEAQRVREIALS